MDIRLNKEIVQDWRRAQCPKPDCNTICYQELYQESYLYWTFFSCPKCNKEFCSKCLDNWHPGMTCQELSADKNGTSPSLQANAIFESDLDIKYCPKCNLTIQKTGGCSHMTCSRCWHKFCWICLESVPLHSVPLHYTYRNCKGKLNHTITTTESLLLFTIIIITIIIYYY